MRRPTEQAGPAPFGATRSRQMGCMPNAASWPIIPALGVHADPKTVRPRRHPVLSP